MGVGFLKRTGAEIGILLNNAKKSFFIMEKKKYRKCPALNFSYVKFQNVYKESHYAFPFLMTIPLSRR